MQSIRGRLSTILIICSIITVILSAVFVNLAIYNTFNKYMSDIQIKRNTRIIEYFREIYIKQGGWKADSGEELMHEAYMNKYFLTLMDENKNVVWGMNPNDLEYKNHTMGGKSQNGVYSSNTFNIEYNNKTVGYIVIGQYSPVLLSDEDVSFKSSINKGIILSTILTILIVSGISLKISNQFSSPIKKVSQSSVELSSGNYESHLYLKSNITELNNLIDSINSLGQKLKNQDQLRRRLISDISHELRTPLNILQNNLEAMIDGVVEVTENQLISLNEEVIRFGKLLDSLNTLKELEEKENNKNFNNICVSDIVFNVYKEFLLKAKEKNIHISFKQESESDFIIWGDLDKLKQVFINILSNAIKFTQNNGNVRIVLKQNKKQVIVEISDDGIGIKKEDMPFIFERLYRGDKSRSQIAGSGIGLTIVKKILDLHSAKIEVESEEKVGSMFRIYFETHYI